MKLSIQLDGAQDDDHHAFTSSDWIRGEVVLALQRADAVSKITLSLQGKLISSVQSATTNPLPLLDGNFHAVDSHKALKITQTIFPQHNVPIPSRGFSLPKGNTGIPFKIRFPILSQCAAIPHEWIKHVKTTLPPSFTFTAPGNDGSAAVEYCLKVEVVRPQLFKSDMIERRSIKFRPLDPALPPPMMEPSHNKSTRNVKYEVLKSPGPNSSGAQVLDTRLVTLESTLPAPAILRIGSGLQLGATLFAAAGNDFTPPLFLRSFTLNLLTEVTIDIGPNLKTWQTFTELYSDMNLEEEVGAEAKDIIPAGLLHDARIPDSAVPSFTTCTFKQEHFIVVAIGLSYGRQGRIMHMKTTINVEIHSGIQQSPGRDILLTPDEEESEDQFTFIPWRIGSERHLGILSRRDSRSDNAPPPPYA